MRRPELRREAIMHLLNTHSRIKSSKRWTLSCWTKARRFKVVSSGRSQEESIERWGADLEEGGGLFRLVEVVEGVGETVFGLQDIHLGRAKVPADSHAHARQMATDPPKPLEEFSARQLRRESSIV